jgi:nucleotide-binding universal stress UspA family protein
MIVFLALDDSIYSDLAFASVQHRGWNPDTKFVLCTVIEQICLSSGNRMKPEDQEAWREKMEASLDVKVKKLQETHPDCTVEKLIEFGVPGERIIAAADRIGATDIVLGSHGRTGFSHYLLGSVAEQVSSCTPCTVEIVKSPKLLVRSPEVLPHNLNALLEQKKILLVVTGTDDGKSAEKWVLESKWETDQKISLITVCGTKKSKALTLIGKSKTNPQKTVSATEYHQSQIAKFAQISRQVTDSIRIGDAAEEILDYADKIEANLIVIGADLLSVGQDGTGTVASAVAAGSRCSVRVVKERLTL